MIFVSFRYLFILEKKKDYKKKKNNYKKKKNKLTAVLI